MSYTRNLNTLLLVICCQAVLLMACNRNDPGVTPTIEPPKKLPAKTAGNLRINITGQMSNGTVLSENLNLQQYFTGADASITVDSSVRPAIRIFNISRWDTASSSQVVLRFAMRHWSDTGTVARNKAANVVYYYPDKDSPTKWYLGNVPNNINVDGMMRVNRLVITENGGYLFNIRGEFLMAPVSGGASSTLVSGDFDIPLDTLQAW